MSNFAVYQTNYFLPGTHNVLRAEFWDGRFSTKQEAQEAIKKWHSQTYYLAHGEIDRPDVKILDLRKPKNAAFWDRWHNWDYRIKFYL